MKCQNCNHENRDNAVFCVMCGSRIEKKVDDINTKKLAYVVSDNEEVDENLLNNTVDKEIGELVHYTCGNVMGKTCFKYDIHGLKTLQEYTSGKVIKREEILTILLNIINAVLGLQMKGLKLNNLFLKTSQMFIDENNLMVKMICLPISNRNQDKSIDGLIKEILLNTEFDYNENCRYVKELLRFFDENDTFDIKVFTGIIEKYIEEEPVEVKTEKKVNIRKEVVEEDFDEGATTLLQSEDDDYDDEGTTVLSQEPNYSYLIRLNNDEKIELNKGIFRIGKDKRSADYIVTDNKAVSRQHADIITKNGECYIMDLDSTNHTYIDNKVIPSKVEVKIEDGNIIKLGNEEFQFFE